MRAIDVDFRGDREDFDERCRVAENVLLALGISRNRMLVCPSPSGGRHYRIFFRKPVFTSQLPVIFQMAGLPLEPGRFEVFPNETLGFRLPFGHIPGEPHNPLTWVTFIRAYRNGEFPRVDWEQMVKRAQTRELQRAQAVERPGQRLERSPAEIPKAAMLGIPRRLKATSTPPGPAAEDGRGVSTPNIGQACARSKEQIESLWSQGITVPGTRVSVTKAIAWHLVFVERLPAREVSKRLVEWIYRTGRTTSRTVQTDLANGSREAEKQTDEIVAWFDARRKQDSPQPRRLFAKQELDHIVALAKTLPNDAQHIRARFALDFLNFAKSMGWKSETGYECRPSVDGVIKKWENCHGASKYKLHLDWALKVGLLVLVKEKSQRTHWPRTYAVVVPLAAYEEWTLSYHAAVDYIQHALHSASVCDIPTLSHSVADGYMEFVSLEEREEYHQLGTRCKPRVDTRAMMKSTARSGVVS